MTTCLKENKVPSFSWEAEMPHKCTTCDSNRFISGILLQNAELKREIDRLKEDVALMDRIVRNFRKDIRFPFQEQLAEERRKERRYG